MRRMNMGLMIWCAVIITMTLSAALSAAVVTDGLIIHLKADALTGTSDGAAVTSWADSSTGDSVDGTVTGVTGHGNPTFETGVLNGLPVVRFDEVQSAHLLSNSWTIPTVGDGFTIIAVFTSGADAAHAVDRLFQIGGGSGASGKILAADVSGSGTGYASGGRFNNGFALTQSANNPLTPGFHIAVWQIGNNARYDSLYYAVDDLDAETLDNTSNPANTTDFNAGLNANALSLGVGKSGTNEWIDADFYGGDIAEILVYNAQLSQSQILQTGASLSEKYGLAFAGAAISVDQGDGQTAVREGGFTDTLTFVMTSNPGSYPVTVDLSDLLNPDQVTVTPAQRVFNASNWHIPQDVTVTAIDDDAMERARHETTLTLNLTTNPASAYYGMTLGDIEVHIEDNDCGAWGFNRADFNLDCQVNLEDFAWFAQEWVECSLPDATCQDYRF